MIITKPLVVGTTFILTGTLIVETVRHQDMDVHSHQERPETLDQMTGKAAMTSVFSGSSVSQSFPMNYEALKRV